MPRMRKVTERELAAAVVLAHHDDEMPISCNALKDTHLGVVQKLALKKAANEQICLINIVHSGVCTEVIALFNAVQAVGGSSKVRGYVCRIVMHDRTLLAVPCYWSAPATTSVRPTASALICECYSPSLRWLPRTQIDMHLSKRRLVQRICVRLLPTFNYASLCSSLSAACPRHRPTRTRRAGFASWRWSATTLAKARQLCTGQASHRSCTSC